MLQGSHESEQVQVPKLKRLIYVSCGFDALERDLRELIGSGKWKIKSADGFILFPGSEHIETVVVLDAISGKDGAPNKIDKIDKIKRGYTEGDADADEDEDEEEEEEEEGVVEIDLNNLNKSAENMISVRDGTYTAAKVKVKTNKSIDAKEEKEQKGGNDAWVSQRKPRAGAGAGGRGRKWEDRHK